MAKKTETVTIYITKYAVTCGIRTSVAEVSEDGYAIVRATKPGSFGGFFSKNDYKLTREDAIKRATELKAKKVKALEAQLKKLKAFDVTEIKPAGEEA